MRRHLSHLFIPAVLAVGTLGVLAGTTPQVAGAASYAHSMTAAKTWHGKVTKIDETMGTTSAFTVDINMKTYVVHWDAMTKFELGTKKDIKVGALVAVTGTLKGTTITATKLSI